jgi:primosomal protein N''
MQIAKVLIEHPNVNIQHTFDYAVTTQNVEKGMRVEVEFNKQKVIGFVEDIVVLEEDKHHYEEMIGFEIKDILAVIDEEPLLNEELFACADYLSYITIAPKISVFQAMLPSKLKPKSSFGKIKETAFVQFLQDEDANYKGKKKEALDYLRTVSKMERSEFNRQFSGVLKQLEKDGFVKVVFEESKFEALTKETMQHLDLRSGQKEAFEKIKKCNKDIVLLHGATGSGKTEVYLHLAQNALDEGKQVLLLVPEISLTPQMVQRVESRFGNQVAIYHSRLNNQEKYEQYQRVRRKEVSIVVGTRSAIFMPFESLGLIVLDEEHDSSYKQDSLPRYHTRDVAIWRGKYHACKVILGSATPSLETYARAHKGVYELVELNERINGQELPKCHLIDTRTSLQSGDNHILTEKMRHEIKKRLEKKQQIILLLNRRGYIPIIKCRDCGTVVMCKHCEIAMNYHKDEMILICHTCGFTQKMPSHCESCGSTKFTWWGYGTQRLEEECRQLFPNAKTYRMDTDTVSRKGSHEKILNDFERDGDILLGTQMIAKGLDYPRVTMVGILSADALLARSDYRSVELTFDLIVQASGRSGRADEVGEVFIQAFDTSHYAITTACRHDYKRFFREEMQYRHVGFYPPYSYMCSIVCSHKDQSICEEETNLFLVQLQAYENLRILGPSQLLKKRNQARSRILVKCANFEEMVQIIHKEYDLWLAERKRCSVVIDVNPLYLD